MEFNVIKEPCIPVRMITGEFKDLSIRDVFCQAHEIQTVYTENLFEEYGIKRLLVTFFMDWLRPQDDYELISLYEEGHFDIVSFDSYIKECENLGDVFNLYSKTHPFLQTKYDKEKDEVVDKKGKSTSRIIGIENLFYDLPSNTNHTFFYKDYSKITSKECFRGLCALSPFLYSMGGEGYCGSVNGDSPYYLWIKGKNLFQEIIINSVSQDTWNEEVNNVISYVGGTGKEVIWRRREEIKKKESFDDISLLEGLTFMGRRVTLIPDENSEYISKISINPSSKFLNTVGAWRDPHCSYSLSKKDEIYTNKPNEGDIIWLNAGQIYLFDRKLVPMTFLKFGNYNIDDAEFNIERFGLDIFEVTVYGGYNPGSKGIYKWWIKETLNLNINILGNLEYSKKYIEALNCIKMVSRRIKSSLVNKIDLNIYLTLSKEYIETTFISDLLSDKNINTVMQKFKESLISFAIKCYEFELNSIDLAKSVEIKVGKDSKIVTSYQAYYDDLYRMIGGCKKDLGLENKNKRKEKRE